MWFKTAAPSPFASQVGGQSKWAQVAQIMAIILQLQFRQYFGNNYNTNFNGNEYGHSLDIILATITKLIL